MSEGFYKSKDLLFWNRRLISIGGMWPLQTTHSLFYSWLAYCLVHLGLGIADLVYVFGNLEGVIANLGETGYLITILSKMFVLRYSSLLRTIMRQVASNESEVDCKSEEEKEIYMTYTRRGLRFFKFVIWITAISTIAYFFKALKTSFENGALDELEEFPLPYHLRFFFNITDVRTYLLIYAYQCPIVYIFTCHGILACFVWSLILDVCGQLSVLSFRIKNMKSNSFEKDNHSESVLRDIVEKHKKIIWNSKAIDGAFNIALLIELIFCTVIMGLCMYNMIVNSDSADATGLFSFLLYIFMMLIIMYGYCLAGDYLVQESLNVRDSYYECDWYNMSPRCKKMIIMCMIRTRIPLQITGGGFYIYNMESLTSVVKTSMAYVSMLRQVV